MPTATKAKKSKKEKKVQESKAGSGECGIERSHDVPWGDKKVAVIKALKALKALGASSARSALDVADKAGVSTRDVRHYCYHAKVSGLTDVHTVEGIRGHAFALTAKGAKCDPAAELKAQGKAREAAKESKE